MRAYENDKEIKIPNWYLRLPQGVINKIADVGMWIQSLMPKRKINTTNARNIKFLIDEKYM